MTILDQIVAGKRREMAALRARAEARFRAAAAARTDFRDFAAALAEASGPVPPAGETGGAGRSEVPAVRLIAEVKKASPSAGVICPDYHPGRVARAYERAGAAALSVLTDAEFFQGRLEDLEEVRAAVSLPLLRKDFIIEELQVYESAARGADAILLIAAILDDRQLRDFRAIAEHLGMAALVEVHDEAELDRAIGAGAALLGINNRNLRDFTVNLTTTEQLARLARTPGRARTPRPIVVAESGIRTRADVERLSRAGADAILVGESLMRSGDIGGKIKELLG